MAEGGAQMPLRLPVISKSEKRTDCRCALEKVKNSARTAQMKYPPAEIMVLCRLDPHLGCRHHDFGHFPPLAQKRGNKRTLSGRMIPLRQTATFRPGAWHHDTAVMRAVADYRSGEDHKTACRSAEAPIPPSPRVRLYAAPQVAEVYSDAFRRLSPASADF